MEKGQKIIVAHPGKQHSYRLAEALEKEGYLSNYITTVYDSENSWLMRIVKRVIGRQNKKRADNRRMDVIPQEKIIQFCEGRGLLTLAILRVDKKRYFYNKYNDHVSKVFGRKVAKFAIKKNVDAVICYDTSAQYCFEVLKKRAPHIIRIIDNAAMNRYGLCKIYQELDREYGILENRTGFKSYLLDEREALRFKREAFLADYHIVASSFSEYTLTSIGINEDCITVIPYGVETDLIPHKENYSVSGKLKVLFVGEISPQKGVYNLLQMAEIFKNEIEFHVVGGGIEKLSKENQEKIKETTIYHGYLLQEDLFRLYSNCDVFIFPSLGDGFGFVVVEAMAAGLPAICSTNSVGSDVVRNGENGFVFKAGDSECLKNRIEYFLKNRYDVEKMGKAAASSAKEYTWENYNKKVRSFIQAL